MHVTRFFIAVVTLSLLCLPAAYALENSAAGVKAKVKTPITEEEKLRLIEQKKVLEHKKLVQSLIGRVPEIPALVTSGKIDKSEIPDPHWQEDSCQACHTETQPRASKHNLRSGAKADQFCLNCHSAGIQHSYIHPSAIKPSAKRLQQMKPVMKNIVEHNDGKIGCLTCHDITLQCKLQSRQKHENPKAFRGGPYIKRHGLCEQCHSAESYQRFNPHQQINASGEIETQKCRVCHSGSLDDLQEARSIDEVGFHAKKNTESMCWGCHQWKPHPGGQFSFFKNKKGPNHLVKPSEQVLANMEEALEEKGILMPLEPGTGRVFCATCHNPHAKGIIKNPAAAYGAGSDKKLRSKPLCIICHTK
ncbi:MAG: hypothetical protein OEY11_08110 [Gammaproteobacteria bacterium]|nr:hypothetical protein [Gammaproteobacteria bacterium]